MSTNDCPFLADVRMLEPLFYLPYLTPIQIPNDYKEGTWESCNLTKKGFVINWQAEAWLSIEFIDGQTK